MTTIGDVTTRWAERAKNPGLRERNNRRGNIIADGDSIYSYGHHFEMATVFRNEDGTARLVLLNGDRYSSSTSGHQSMVRAAVRRELPDVPCIVVPYTALRAAGIQFASIVPIDVRPDGTEYTLQVQDELPTSAKTIDGTHVYRRGAWLGHHEPGEATETRHESNYPNGLPDGAMPVEGDSGWYTIPIDPDRCRRGTQVLAVDGEIVERREDGRYTWYSKRHWLGDALFAARANGRRKRVKFLSSFDRNEKRRLYFLCELPATSATDIDGALQALKPETVVLAEGMGRECERQGDIFGVPMPGLTIRDLKRQGATIAKRSAAKVNSTLVPAVSLLGTSHVATEVATMPDGTQYARGCMTHDPRLLGEWREPDHARCKLGDGKTWYLAQRNTVPVR